MKKYFMFFVIISIFHFNSGCLQETVSAVSSILKEVFHEKIICYITDKNSTNYLTENALFDTEFSIISISYNHLTYSATDVPCTGYIVVLFDGNDFIKYYLNNKKNSSMFKSWTRLLLMYDRPPDIPEKLNKLVISSAIDILVVELKQFHYSNLSFSYDGIVIKSLHRNSTILSWHANQSKIHLTKFRPIRWMPPQVRVALFHCPPFMYVNKTGVVDEGIEYHVIKEVIKPTPIEAILIDSEDWQLASDTVEHNINDIAACSQWHINSKGKNIDFTYPFRQVVVTFLVKKPTLLPDFTFIFQPLHGLVYLVTIFILLLVLIGFSLVNNIYKALDNANYVYDLVLQLLYLVRVLSMGGVTNLPIFLCTSVKFLLGFWYLYCVILSTYYSAGMTSCLTNPRYTNNIDTLQKMVDYKIEWFSIDTDLRDYFLSLDISVLNSLAKLHVRKKRVVERSETSAITVKTIGGRYVTDIDKLPHEDRKYYKALTDSIGTYYFGFVLQKNSPLTKLFDDTIFRLVESGIYDNWLIQVLYQNDKYQSTFFSNYIEDPHMNVNIKKIQGAFYLLAIGYILGFISFLVEYIIGKGAATYTTSNRNV